VLIADYPNPEDSLVPEFARTYKTNRAKYEASWSVPWANLRLDIVY